MWDLGFRWLQVWDLGFRLQGLEVRFAAPRFLLQLRNRDLEQSLLFPNLAVLSRESL